MKTQHTPDPWKSEEDGNNGIEVVDQDLCVVAEIMPRYGDGVCDEDWANARLIAAAPELLAALQRIVKATFNYEDLTQPILDAQSVIAKATINH
jgi:hypothetical protein